MKHTFNGWYHVNTMDLNTVADLIMTGKNAHQTYPDIWMYQYLGNKDDQLNVLDFGCGMGRNSFGLAHEYPKWTIVGYDNENMIAKSREYCDLRYGGMIPRNLWFISDWSQLSKHKVDAIFCCIVLQHIYSDALKLYLSDFKKMTKRLVVMGRRYNDDPLYNDKSTWRIMEEVGYFPDAFYSGDGELIEYMPDGDKHEHNLAVYNLG